MEICRVPFSVPDIGEAEIAEVVDTLRSGWITTGPKTRELERQLADFVHTSRAVCLNSASAGLELTLRLFEIGPGDEVITTAYTYTATASAICHVGARPILIDTAPGSYEMDYDQLETAVTERTKAVIPVELGGRMCDYDRLFAIAEEKRHLFQPKGWLQDCYGRLLVLSDGAHGLGAVRDGFCCGERADFTVFSFHAAKNLTTAEGGAVTWRTIPDVEDEKLYRRYMLMAMHGQSKDAWAKRGDVSWEYDIVDPFYKCNLTDLAASIGLAQLRRYPKMLERRREIIRRYDAVLRPLGVDTPEHFGRECVSSAHLYLMRLPDRQMEERNQLICELAEQGIAANVHYKPLPLLTAYRKLGFRPEEYPNACRQYENEVTLPLYSSMAREDVEYVLEHCVRLLACG